MVGKFLIYYPHSYVYTENTENIGLVHLTRKHLCAIDNVYHFYVPCFYCYILRSFSALYRYNNHSITLLRVSSALKHGALIN